MAFCNCTTKYRNSGLPAATKVLKESKWLIFAPAQDSNGNPPEILLSDTLDAAFFDAKFQAANPLDRWYVYGGVNGFQNINSPQRADPTVFETNEGNKYVSRQGSRDYQGHLFDAPHAYIANIESMRCKPYVFFGIDECGELAGKICVGAGDRSVLRGYTVNSRSIYAIPIEGTSTEAGRVQLNFQTSMTENDADFRVIKTDYDWAASNGLIDTRAKIKEATTTDVTATLVLEDGSLEGVLATGLTTFTITNVTQGTTITVSSVTEDPAGSASYMIAFASGVASSDVLRVQGLESGIATDFNVTAQ